MLGQDNYIRAVQQGHYELNETPSLYDPTRIHWENELTKIFLQKHLSKLLARTNSRKTRVLDLGCGPGQGFKLLSETRYYQDLAPGGFVFNEDEIEYVGLDINPAVLSQAEQIFSGNKNVIFVNQNLRLGLGKIRRANSFDIYYSSYAALSHLSSSELNHLLSEIVEHTDNYSLVVLDLLGRNSIEWTAFWGQESATYNYTMSWLYPEVEREEAPRFPMTFWTRTSLKELIDIKPNIKILDIMDRSILMGRHVDTGEYNSMLKPIRKLINSLFNPATQTNTEELFINGKIIPDFYDLRIPKFLDRLVLNWNTLIAFYNYKLESGIQHMTYSSELDGNLLKGLTTLNTAIELAKSESWRKCHFSGDILASFIEPQLAYALRNLEYDTQLGMGVGHGLLAVLEIQK